MSSFARFVVYDINYSDFSTILRTGICPVGQEADQASGDWDEGYFNEEEIADILASIGGESINDAEHYIVWKELDPVGDPGFLTPVVTPRAVMSFDTRYTYQNLAILGEYETVTFENLPGDISEPPVEWSFVSIVDEDGVVINDEGEPGFVGAITTEFYQKAFPAGNVYDVYISTIPAGYFPVHVVIGTPLNGNMFYSARGYGQLGKLTPKITKTLPSVVATGAVGALARLTLGIPTGVTATAGLGLVVAVVNITTELIGVESIAQIGAIELIRAYAIAGVSATGQVGVVEKQFPVYIVGVEGTGTVPVEVDTFYVEDS